MEAKERKSHKCHDYIHHSVAWFVLNSYRSTIRTENIAIRHTKTWIFFSGFLRLAGAKIQEQFSIEYRSHCFNGDEIPSNTSCRYSSQLHTTGCTDFSHLVGCGSYLCRYGVFLFPLSTLLAFMAICLS